MDASLRARVEADLAEDRLWKARDRLTGAFANRRSDLELINALGDVYARMGDLPAAGRWWFFTAGEEDHHHDARKAFVVECGSRPEVIAQRLPPVAEAAPLSPAARERVTAVDFTGWAPDTATEDHVPEATTLGERVGCALLGFVGSALTIGVWLAGAIWLASFVI